MSHPEMSKRINNRHADNRYFMIFSLPWRFWTNFPENNVMGVISREAVEKLKKIKSELTIVSKILRYADSLKNRRLEQSNGRVRHYMATK